MRHAMIMAGGSGTRLWPMSRGETPKQLIGLFDGKSLLEIAAERLTGVVASEQQWICTNQKHQEIICEKLGLPTSQLLGEPEPRDTLNAVAFTAAVLHKQDPDAIFTVLTADHIIRPQDEFARCLDIGFTLAEEDASRFVTFGITPTFPATGYGYVELGDVIHDGARICKRFVEKPDEQTAEEYIASGNFAWNSGMFVFHAGSFLTALARLQPESFAGIKRIAESWETDEQQKILNEVYPTLPKISVDYGMMEPASSDDAISICTVPMDVQWLDVGSWPSYGDTLTPDSNGNRSDTKSLHLDSNNTLCVSSDKSHTITTIGCEDLVIVHTDDATLVFPVSEAQRVKEMHGLVDSNLK
ncbi:MAG TPA: mannose-1-phosphate guanylyltransferase [Phycisphaerales bacterium]|nr:mannose-1-phosphate guanylyltransferase [Phycisphaerales bacterium]